MPIKGIYRVLGLLWFMVSVQVIGTNPADPRQFLQYEAYIWTVPATALIVWGRGWLTALLYVLVLLLEVLFPLFGITPESANVRVATLTTLVVLALIEQLVGVSQKQSAEFRASQNAN